MSAFSSNDEVTLISGDGEEFKVSSKVAVLSALAAGMISDDDQDEEKRIPLPNVRREILAKVLEFCNHYHEEKMTEFVKVSDVNYHSLSLSLNITRHSVLCFIYSLYRIQICLHWCSRITQNLSHRWTRIRCLT